jgi:hypothetical protein
VDAEGTVKKATVGTVKKPQNKQMNLISNEKRGTVNTKGTAEKGTVGTVKKGTVDAEGTAEKATVGTVKKGAVDAEGTTEKGTVGTVKTDENGYVIKCQCCGESAVKQSPHAQYCSDKCRKKSFKNSKKNL